MIALPFLCCLITISNANARVNNAPLLNGELKAQWYNLNHYDEKGISGIKNADFFVSPNGQQDPDEEYSSFLNLLSEFKNQPSDTGKETLCRFPARMTLLTKHLKWFKGGDRPQCEEYLETVKPQHVQSVSLIFASGYFDNPSSYYGHTLLRFNYNESKISQKTLDSSLNYGADITNNEGTFTYVFKGLTGGYGASYQRNNDFVHSHRYTNGQLRDLWEYDLNLTPDQVRFVLEHSWELMNAKFDYFFLSDNCAHRIINVVERATGKDLTKSHAFWLLPIQVLQESYLAENNGSPLITDEVYVPSLKSTFTKRYQGLSREDKQRFITFFKKPLNDQIEFVETLSSDILLLILDQLDIEVAKLSIKENTNSDDRKNIEDQRRAVLFALLNRPAMGGRQKLDWDKSQTLSTSRRASVVRWGYTQREGEDAATLKYQIANNDLLDKPMAGQEKSRFIMGAIEAEITENEVNLRDLTIVDIANLNTNALPMTMTKEYSWGIRLGYNHRNRICDSCGSVGVTGTVGKAERLSENILVYSLAGARLNHKKVEVYDYVTLVSESAALFDLNDYGRLNLGVNFDFDPKGSDLETVAKIDYAIDISKNNDLRLGVESNLSGESMVTLRLGHFFN